MPVHTEGSESKCSAHESALYTDHGYNVYERFEASLSQSQQDENQKSGSAFDIKHSE
jgi:hypothetical protein